MAINNPRQKAGRTLTSHTAGGDIHLRLKRMEGLLKAAFFLCLILIAAVVFLGWLVWKTQAGMQASLNKQSKHVDRLALDSEQIQRDLNQRIEQAHETLLELSRETQSAFDEQLTKANQTLSRTLSVKGNVSQGFTQRISGRLSSHERRLANLTSRVKETRTDLENTQAKLDSLIRIINEARKAVSRKASTPLKFKTKVAKLSGTSSSQTKPSPPSGSEPENVVEQPSNQPEEAVDAKSPAGRKEKFFPVVLNGDSLIITFKKGPTKKKRVEISGSGYVGTVYIPSGYIADVSGKVNGGIFIVSSELNGKIREKLIGSANTWELKPKNSLFHDLWRALTE